MRHFICKGIWPVTNRKFTARITCDSYDLARTWFTYEYTGAKLLWVQEEF